MDRMIYSCVTAEKQKVDSEPLIEVHSVSKKFCRTLRRSLWYGLCDMAGELNPLRKVAPVPKFDQNGNRDDGDGQLLRRDGLRRDEFWAVKDVSFAIRRGECLGLIGKNGAGKTTLLKMLNGLIKPDSGRITMRGKIGALIALGAGFTPVLTGRENIYVNASVLGLTKREIDEKLDEIIDFAEIGRFIDSPVQSYSSGMQVRLGFAIATALNPDILLLDEVLAVGDVAFRNKCYRRVVAIRNQAAVVFVSHNMDWIARMCDRVMVLSGGSVVSLGNVEQGVSTYDEINAEMDNKEENFTSINDPLTAFNVICEHGELISGACLPMQWQVCSSERIDHFQLRVFVISAAGSLVADGTFDSAKYGISIAIGPSKWEVCLQTIPLKSGIYKLSFNLVGSKGEPLAFSHANHRLKITGSPASAIGPCQLHVSAWQPIPASVAVLRGEASRVED